MGFSGHPFYSLSFSAGDPYSDCLEVKYCTNCRGTGLLNSFRTFDGTCNRLAQPLLGSSITKHQRFLGKSIILSLCIVLAETFYMTFLNVDSLKLNTEDLINATLILAKIKY